MLGKTELLHLLEKSGIPFSCEHHEPVLNMKESETLTLSLDGARCKNLLLQDKDRRYFHVLTTATKSLDLTAVAQALGSKRLSFASEERLFDLLGIRTGSLSPLALVNDEARSVRLVIDSALLDESIFLLHPMENNATVGLAKPDLVRFLASIGHAPEWVELAAREVR